MSTSFIRLKENTDGRDFYYTSRENVRNELEISSAVISDTLLDKKIRRFSKYLNKITGQWFEPIFLLRHFNGLGHQILDLEDGAPLVLLKSAEISRERTLGATSHFEYVVPLSSIFDGAVEERFLSIDPTGRRLQNGYVWPRGNSNILLNGWWGRLEQPKYLETYISSGIVSLGTDSIQLQNVKNINQVMTFGIEPYTTQNPKYGYDNNIRKRDIAIFIDSSGFEVGRRIINSVNYTTNMVTFDSFLESPINSFGSGTKVITFGAAPEGVEEIILQFVKDNQDSDDDLAFKRSIKQEKTDLYQYTRFTPLEGGSPVHEELTSSARINQMIMDFCIGGHVSV